MYDRKTFFFSMGASCFNTVCTKQFNLQIQIPQDTLHYKSIFLCSVHIFIFIRNSAAYIIYTISYVVVTNYSPHRQALLREIISNGTKGFSLRLTHIGPIIRTPTYQQWFPVPSGAAFLLGLLPSGLLQPHTKPSPHPAPSIQPAFLLENHPSNHSSLSKSGPQS